MSIKVKKRNFLKKKKIKEIKNELGEYGDLLQNKKNVEILEAEPNSFILVDGEPYIIIIDDKPFPTLKAALENQIDSKKVTVDMGAIRFVSNGADIMSPGIVAADDGIEKGDIVLIIDETHGSIFDATQTMAMPLDNGTTEVQVVSWYDNENSYTSQMVRTIKYFGKLLSE